MVGFGMKQKIETLKMRRRQDRINVILTAAARGDIVAMKQAFRVWSHYGASNFAFYTLVQIQIAEKNCAWIPRRNLATTHMMPS